MCEYNKDYFQICEVFTGAYSQSYTINHVRHTPYFFISFFVFLLVNLTYLQFDMRMCPWLKQNAGIIGCAESTLIGGSIYCR